MCRPSELSRHSAGYVGERFLVATDIFNVTFGDVKRHSFLVKLRGTSPTQTASFPMEFLACIAMKCFCCSHYLDMRGSTTVEQQS